MSNRAGDGYSPSPAFLSSKDTEDLGGIFPRSPSAGSTTFSHLVGETV